MTTHLFSTFLVGIFFTCMLASCGQNSSEVNSRPTALNDAVNLTSKLLTGKDRSESQAFWQCDISSQDEIYYATIRFWEEQQGSIRSTDMNWTLTNNSTLELETEDSKTTLSQLTVQGTGSNARLTAIDSFNNSLSCSREGPQLANQPGTLFNDFSDANSLENELTEHLMGDLSNTDVQNWYCSLSRQNSGTIVSHQIELNDDGNAKLDGVEAKWIVDDRYKLIITTLNSTLYIHDIEFIDNEKNMFKANSYDNVINCTT